MKTREEIVTRDTAILAKDKNFDWNIDSSWSYLDKNGMSMVYNAKTCVLHPTQSLLQRWLREVHKLIVTVNYIYEYDSTPYTSFIYKEGDSVPTNKWEFDFETFEEALEKGLFEALKLIK